MRSPYMYILVMAVVTYLIRVLPLTLIRKEIKNKFVKSFLYYVPYATLAAMTFPAILSATDYMLSSLIGFIVALVLAIKNKSLLTVAACGCIAVFVVELFIR
ncbi:MAG: AzlD domain-containing protein [Butyrivibrio sp.]|nr:AzlD domain-containing protein [Butyrivibrio sp.]